MDLIDAILSIDKSHEGDVLNRLTTVWGENLDTENVLPEYPRPQLMRDSFINLNGYWKYSRLSTNFSRLPIAIQEHCLRFGCWRGPTLATLLSF